MSSAFLDTIVGQAIPLVVETYIYAVSTGLTAYILYQKCTQSKRQPTAPSTFIVSVALVTSFLFTFIWMLDVYILWATAYQSTLGDDTSEDEIQRYLRMRETTLNLAQYGLLPAEALVFTLGDCVSLWRAYVIVGRPRSLFILSVCLILAEIASWIVSILKQTNITQVSNIMKEIRILKRIPFITAASVQLIATLLIAWKTWTHWKDIREFVGPSNVQRSIATLVVVIESGTLYLALLILYPVLPTVQNETSVSFVFIAVFQSSAFPLIALYPILVAVLVTARLAILDRSINSSNPRSDLSFVIPVGGDNMHQDNIRLEENNRGEVLRGHGISLGQDIELEDITATSKCESREETVRMPSRVKRCQSLHI